MPVIQSNHRGRPVVLSRRHASPRVLGPRRARASRLLEHLPTPPSKRDWLRAAEAQAIGGELGPMLNDQLGCCTISAPGHAKQIWTANNGQMETPPDSAILADYVRVDGYVDGRPETDQGGIIAEVMAAWKGTAGVAGSRIDGYVPVSPQNLDHVFKAIDRYGCLNLGVSLPLSAQDQEVWTLAMSAGPRAEPGSWGGHDALCATYNRETGLFEFETWGMRQAASLDWVLAYCDEAWAPVCTKYWAPKGLAPNGYSAADLIADLRAVEL